MQVDLNFTQHGFPADFVAEGLDQTRGWFYTLTVLATALFDKPAYKNLIVNGLVLAAYVAPPFRWSVYSFRPCLAVMARR